MTTPAQENGNGAAVLDMARLARLADEVIQHIQRGETVSSGFLADHYPNHAEKLREFLPAIEALAELSRSGNWQVPAGNDPLTDGDGFGSKHTLGDFRILRQIGRGGMGIVYEAEQISLRRRVALKTLPFAGVLDQRQLARFKNESLAAAALQHPNIVPVYAVGCERGVHYYAMQFVGGQNLAQLIHELRIREGLEERGEASTAETESLVQEISGTGDRRQETGKPDAPATDNHQPDASARNAASTLAARKSSTAPTRKERQAYYRNIARLGIQAAEALAHAHEEGVIHRDIKPSNLLLDAGGKLWVTDFGLARTRVDAGMTMTGDLVGTLRYMSPEQTLAKRVPIDHRTDIYSLGATLYELLTLQPMISSDDQAELLRRIAFDEPLPPRRLRSDIPLDLQTIVLKAVEREPRERYVSADQLRDDLDRFLDSRPIVARRQGIAGTVVKWSRRHRPIVLSVVAALLVVLGLGTWVVMDWKSRRAVTAALVNEALNESAKFQAQEKWPEALAAAKRADALAESGSGTPELRSVTTQRRIDVEAAIGLYEVRGQLGIRVNWDRLKEYVEWGDAEYERQFEDYGIPIGRMPVGDAAEKLMQRTIRLPLAIAIDSWAKVRMQSRGEADPTWRPLLQIAKKIDPDPWRNALRDAYGLPGSLKKERLIELAKKPDILDSSPVTLCILAEYLLDSGTVDDSIRLLIAAQEKYPRDYWINLHLGALMKLKGRSPQAVGFSRAALVIQPESAISYYHLGLNLVALGDLEEAITAFRRALQLQPDFVLLHVELGKVHNSRKEYSAAIAELRRATHLRPFEAHLEMGRGYLQQRKLDDASREFRAAIDANPNAILAHHYLGTLLLEEGHFGEAQVELRETVRLHQESFVRQPSLLKDVHNFSRYNAACAAAMLVSSRVRNGLGTADSESSQYSQLALQWLRADMNDRRELFLAGHSDRLSRITYALTDSDFSGVRENLYLNVTDESQVDWRVLWDDVERWVTEGGQKPQ
jgi:serine/threonine protein kinase/tetratricopeptide (TPR) repeat protein